MREKIVGPAQDDQVQFVFRVTVTPSGRVNIKVMTKTHSGRELRFVTSGSARDVKFLYEIATGFQLAAHAAEERGLLGGDDHE